MKRILISLLFIAPLLQIQAQDTKSSKDPKPHFAAIHFAPVFESIQKLKTGYGTSLEGAYFINDWFGVGGIVRYSMHPYSYSGFKSSGDAGQLAFSANAYIRKVYLNEKLSILPSVGLGFASTSFPNGTLTQTVSKETAPGVYSSVDTTFAVNALNVSSFLYNIMSLDVNYQFKPNMSVGVKFDYHIAVSNKWPDETMGDFLSIGIGYTYMFSIK